MPNTWVGTEFSDRMVGTSGNEQFYGWDGNDFLYGDGGYDELSAGAATTSSPSLATPRATKGMTRSSAGLATTAPRPVTATTPCTWGPATISTPTAMPATTS